MLDRCAAVFVVVLFAACLGEEIKPAHDGSTAGTEGVARSPETQILTEFRWDLAGIAGQGGGGLMSVKALNDTRFDFRFTRVLDRGSSLPSCLLFGWKEDSFAVLGRPPSVEFRVSSPVVARQWSAATSFPDNFTFSGNFTARAGEEFSIFLTHAAPAEWMAAGGRLELSVRANSSVAAKAGNAKQALCVETPHDFGSGVSAGASKSNVAVGSTERFSLNETGAGWFFLSSDAPYDFAFTGPNVSWHPQRLTGGIDSRSFTGMSPGTFEATLAQAAGLDTRFAGVFAALDS